MLGLVTILPQLATGFAQVQTATPGEQAGRGYAMQPLPTLKDGGFYRLALQRYPTASYKQRYLAYMNAQASINADRNHEIYISLCWHVSLKRYDTVLPQPKQLTGLDKDSDRRRAVLHHKAFDGKHKSTALSDRSLNMLEKWQIVKIKCHVVHMKTKQTRWKLLVIGTGLV